jgi:hypothetical protein
MRTKSAPPNFTEQITDQDVATVRDFIESQSGTEFVRDRRARNVAPPAPEFSQEKFWYVLMGCLLTTQQRSTKGMPVNRFLEETTFPLTLRACAEQDSFKRFVRTTVEEFGGIRRGITVSTQATENWRTLRRGLWKEAEEWHGLLRQQRAREPQVSDRFLERKAAHWADEHFAGIGPKQSRNLWQWLGLTRYEVPLDSRVTDWINNHLSVRVEKKFLLRLDYYEAILDYLQAVCEKAGVLPCELDAAAFDYDNVGLGTKALQQTTEPGYVNPNGQVTVRNTGKPGTDHLQYIYQLACSRCGHVYGANGSDIHERKCPSCQSGAPGLEV